MVARQISWLSKIRLSNLVIAEPDFVGEQENPHAADSVTTAAHRSSMASLIGRGPELSLRPTGRAFDIAHEPHGKLLPKRETALVPSVVVRVPWRAIPLGVAGRDAIVV
jgi:hypothetical protein